MRTLNTKKLNRGQGMVEYGLILGLIAIAIITSMTVMGTSISQLFTGEGAIIDSVVGFISGGGDAPSGH